MHLNKDNVPTCEHYGKMDVSNRAAPEGESANQLNGKTLEEFTMEAFKILVNATKTSNRLPFGRSRDLYESCPTFHNVLRLQECEILSNLSTLVKRTGCKTNIQNVDDDDKFEIIVDVNDSLLERVSISLDEISGVHKTPDSNLIRQQVVSSTGGKQMFHLGKGSGAAQVLNFILNQTKNMEKSQLKFPDKVNNDPNVPFEPKIKYKHNLLRPLALSVRKTEDGVCQYSHPYEFELEKFKPLDSQLVHCEPKLYRSVADTPLHFVTVKEEVSKMVQDLQKYNEMAVDLEHHSYRTFQGFTCLMQISTRDADYIIDTLTLRSALQELNKVFTDPSKVKVFHGADADILWLQRDLSLYVVNMFDTHQAAKLLNYPNLSLAYLLQHFCNVIAQKHFQLADWRIRPLPQELITYAREDTHYLLYIYDNLKNSLLEKCNGQTNLLESAIKESTRICSKVYVKPPFDKDGHLDIYHRSKKLFDNRQKFALQRLFEWRDATARNLDESLAYVLPNHMMLNISEILPREAQGILACCNPVPLPVRQNLLHLHSIILKAREEQLVKPVLEEQRLCRFSTRNSASDNPLHCPHDLNHDEDFRDDLPILLALSENGKTDFKAHDSVVCLKPIVNVFEKIEEASPRFKSLVRLSPYSRYKLAKKYSESIESQASKPNDTIECDKSKINECEIRHVVDTPYHEEKKTTIRTSVNSDLNEKEKDYQARGNTDNAGENGSKQNTNRHCSKRTLHVEPCKATKKRKAMGSVVLSRKTDVNFTNDNMTRKRIKKRQETHFVPYSYESVNFEQYQTSAATVKNPTKKSVRTRCKKVRRNLKISI